MLRGVVRYPAVMPISQRISAILLASLVGACSSSKSPDATVPESLPAPTPSIELEAMDCDGLRAAVVGSVTEAVLHARYGGIQIDDKLGGKGDGTDDDADEEVELESEPPPTEADNLLKVVDDLVFTLSDARLDIVRLEASGKLDPVGYFGVGDGTTAVGMFAYEDVAILIHETTDDSDSEFASVRVTEVDVSDPSSPTLLRQFDVEGEFEMARRQGEDVRLVTSSRWRVDRDVWEIAYGDAPGLPEPDSNADESGQRKLRAAARAEVAALVDTRLGEMTDLIPRLTVDGDATALLKCDDVYTSANRSSVRVSTLTQFAPTDEITNLGIVGNTFAGAVHESTLYAAFSAGWGANAGTSDLHAFDFADGYLDSVALDGALVDEFSVSATAEAVHVITVSDGAQLHTVEFDGDELDPADPRELTDDDLVVANRITSNAAYVATGGSADRIFALPLGESDATGPYQLGGVPSMIHALDADRILVVAQQNNPKGEQIGVRVEVFDADAEPVASAEIETGEFAAWSEAMWEPRSLAYSGDGVVAFPVNIEAWADTGGENFSGVLVYDANNDVTRRGEIDHSDLRATKWCRANDQPDDCDAPQSNPWWTHVRRSAFVGERIVTVSEAGIKVHDVDTLEELSSLVLE